MTEEMRLPDPRDYFPDSETGTWPHALRRAMDERTHAGQKAVEEWTRGLDLPGVGLSVPVPVDSTEEPTTARLPTNATVPDCILTILKCDNVRALVDPDSPIRLSPWLTVFYGRNGSGKSSLAQCVSVLAGVRSPESVPGKATDDPAQDRFAAARRATMRVCRLSDARAQPVSYSGGHEIEWPTTQPPAPVVALRVFDKRFIAKFDAQLRLDMSPELGLHVFDEAVEGLEYFRRIVQETRSNASARAEGLFSEEDRSRAEAALALTEGDTKEALEELRARRDELRRQIADLDDADVAATTIRNHLAGLEAEQAALALLEGPDYSSARLRAASKELADLRAAESVGLRGLLDSVPLAIKDMDAWRSFVLAGEKLVEAEGKTEYPTDADTCVYCGQALSASALTFLKAARNEVGGARRSRIEELADRIESGRKALETACPRLGRDVESLQRGASWLEQVPTAAELLNASEAVLTELSREQARLEHLATPESQQAARTKLTPLLDAAETAAFAREHRARLKEMQDLRRVVRAADDALNEVTTQLRRWNTQKSKAAEALGLAAFKARLVRECERLCLRVSLSVRATSPAGTTERKYAARGREPRQTLSESETATWALADTLAEVAHRGGTDILLVDDPVGSMDTERASMVADRLLAEAENRQVIVLTHNRHFFNAIFDAAKDHPAFKGMAGRALFYFVEAFRGTTGYVSRYSHKETPRALLDRVASLTAGGPVPAETVDLCFLLLRRCIEVIVDQVILRGTRSLFDPEAGHLGWKELKRIRQPPADLVDRLHDLHSGISRVGGLHVTGDYSLLCPIAEDVAYYHGEIANALTELDAP